MALTESVAEFQKNTLMTNFMTPSVSLYDSIEVALSILAFIKKITAHLKLCKIYILYIKTPVIHYIN